MPFFGASVTLGCDGGITYDAATDKLSVGALRVGTSTTAGWVLTADADGNGTWAAGGSGSPGGDPGQLQYHGADGALAGVPETYIDPGLQVQISAYGGASGPNATMNLSVGTPGSEQAQLTVGTDTTNSYVSAGRDNARIAFEGAMISSVTVESEQVVLENGDGNGDNYGAVSVKLSEAQIACADVSSTSSVVLTPASITLSSLAVLLPGLQVYADNAAALADGLVADQVYRTPTGVLMVVYTP